ncbi:fatty acid desaturase family protein [Paraburkholderia sacchari]|uniref:fatty acid desaturase family protein n=1 Tax=Paraburkholderia sacchari TaxID=159450 RepID=UPI001BCCE0C7|nr:fatty acid desaturase [Paraburkholderia sacchari]
MSITTSASIIADQATIRSAIRGKFVAAPASTWRSLRDIAFDWIVVGLIVWAVYRMGMLITPLAIVVIGNRQRALGNLLHEASHQNLSPQRPINDMIGTLLLAAPLLNSLPHYRRQHAKHHAWLGDLERDPDLICCTVNQGDCWLHVYIRVLRAYPAWKGSLLGHLTDRHITFDQRLTIVLWWFWFEAALAVLVGTHAAWLFLLLWIVARGTAFHAITTFREMTDHYGLNRRGIFEYTREVPDHGPVSILLHPHHNGYHVTHHLFPHIPYYALPRAHALLVQIPEFAKRARISNAYLHGQHACVDGWGARHA